MMKLKEILRKFALVNVTLFMCSFLVIIGIGLAGIEVISRRKNCN
tara:strand:- start:7587 stop:7721 length:135 start_codon:yes stop_codon:yes gene_type:complete